MARLEGRRAIVTGAAKGIGRAIAERFAVEGAVLLLADIDPAVEGLARDLGHEAIVADVSRKAEVEGIVARAGTLWGGLDILVNNAGVTHAATLDDLTEDDFDRVFATNLKSALWGTQAAARLMGEGGAVTLVSWFIAPFETT